MSLIIWGVAVLGDRVVRASRRLHRDDSGQDLLEYLLLTAGVAVTIAGILIVGFGLLVPEIVGQLCPTVDPLGGGGAGDCLDPGS